VNPGTVLSVGEFEDVNVIAPLEPRNSRWQKTKWSRATQQRYSGSHSNLYLSVKLDDPSFPAPIYATLIEVDGEEGLQLI
jgi:hypothetical protein